MSSKPINITGKVERSLSNEYQNLSDNSKQLVLGMTDGAIPTSKISPDNKPEERVRLDSAEFSPVSLSILKYHGVKYFTKDILKK